MADVSTFCSLHRNAAEKTVGLGLLAATSLRKRRDMWQPRMPLFENIPNTNITISFVIAAICTCSAIHTVQNIFNVDADVTVPIIATSNSCFHSRRIAPNQWVEAVWTNINRDDPKLEALRGARHLEGEADGKEEFQSEENNATDNILLPIQIFAYGDQIDFYMLFRGSAQSRLCWTAITPIHRPA